MGLEAPANLEARVDLERLVHPGLQASLVPRGSQEHPQALPEPSKERQALSPFKQKPSQRSQARAIRLHQALEQA